MSRWRATVDVAITAVVAFITFYVWSFLGTLALFHLWLPAVETQVAFFRSIGLLHPAHVILAVRDGLLAAALGLIIGSVFGWLLRISRRTFIMAFASGLGLGLLVTSTIDDGGHTVVWLLQRVGFWTLPIAAWVGFAFTSHKRSLRRAA